MTHAKRALLAILAVFAVIVASAGIADAHTSTGHDASCEGVSGTFANFPGGTNTIGVRGDDGSPVGKQFSGSSGTVSASWSELGVDVTDGDDHTYRFSWSADGGGSAGPFVFDAEDCVPDETTTTTTAPTTTTTEPQSPPSTVIDTTIKPPTPVPATPTFTG